MTTASTASRAGFRKLLAIVSAVLLALAFSLQTIPASAAMTEEQLDAQQKQLENKAEELKKQSDELKKKLANTNADLADSQALLKNMKSQVDNARQQLENINQRLSSLNSQISGKNSEIAAKESAISQKEANIQDASDKLNERLRALSKRGNLSSVQMMLSTEEYAEYLVKSKMLERIAENDQKALNDMEAELTKIKADKSALETDKQALADRKKQEQTLQNEASAKKKVIENLYKAIQAEEKKILAQASNYEAQIKKNKQLLDDIDKEIRKIIASKSNNNSNTAAPCSGRCPPCGTFPPASAPAGVRFTAASILPTGLSRFMARRSTRRKAAPLSVRIIPAPGAAATAITALWITAWIPRAGGFPPCMLTPPRCTPGWAIRSHAARPFWPWRGIPAM